MNNTTNIHKIYNFGNTSRNKLTSLSSFYDHSKSIMEDKIYDYINLKDSNHIEVNKKNDIKLKNSLSLRNLSNDENLQSTSHLSLNYLPKRKLNFPKITFSSIKLVKSPEPLKLSNYIIKKENNIMEFKNKNLIKLSKCMDDLIKTKDFIDYLSYEDKNEIETIYKKLRYSHNLFLDFLFDELFNEEVLKSTIWKNLILQFTELYSLISIILNKYIKELKKEENENVKLNRKCIKQDNQLNLNLINLSKLKKIINETDSSKVQNDKKKLEEKINERTRSKNKCLIDNIKLNAEIQDLTLLLDRNKDYFNKYKIKCEEVINKDKIIHELKYLLQKIEHEKNAKINIHEEKYSNLNEELIQANLKNEELKRQIEEYKLDIIEYQSKNKKLLTTLEERKENIYMLNEEILTWMNLYDSEKNLNLYLQ